MMMMMLIVVVVLVMANCNDNGWDEIELWLVMSQLDDYVPIFDVKSQSE